MNIVEHISLVRRQASSVAVLQFSIGVLFGVFVRAYMLVAIVTFFILLLIIRKALYKKALRMFLLGIMFVFVRMFLNKDAGFIPIDTELLGKQLHIKGVVSSDIKRRTNSTQYVIFIKEVMLDGDWSAMEGQIIIYAPRYPKYRQGDILEISGVANEIVDIEDMDFSYKEFMNKKGIWANMFRPVIKDTGERKIGFISTLLLDIRDAIIYKFGRLLPEPHASLIAGIVFGIESDMPDKFDLALQATGTTHIIAASGYNISILVLAISHIFIFLQKKYQILLSFIGIIFYVLFLGGAVSIVRAGIVGVLSLLSKVDGLRNNSIVALFLSGAIILIINPDHVTSIGFQLSFLASIGILCFVPAVKNVLKITAENEFIEAIATSVCATIITFPVISSNFGVISVMSVVSNLLVMPVLEVIMALGVIIILLPEFLSSILVALVGILLEYFIFIVMALSRLPFAMVSVEIHQYFIWGFYFVLLLFLLKFMPVETVIDKNIELEYLAL